LAAEGAGRDTMRGLDGEAQWRIVGTAAGGACQNSVSNCDGDHRESAVEKVPRQPQFGSEAWYQVTADDAFRAGTEQDKAGKALGDERHHRARHERPAIAEADVAALEMVFHQAEVFRFDVLENAQSLHGGLAVC